MDKAVVLLLTAILLFIAGFLVAIYLSYKKIKELEKKNINLYNELKNITSQTDFIYYFRELVGIINTQVDLNTVISNISKIIFNALSLNENEGVVFFLHNSEKKNFDFLHSYPETIKSISLQTNLLNTITTKTEILHNDTLFLIYPIYFEGKLINFLILMLKPEGKDFDTKLKDIEYKVEELIRFISLGFKTPMYYEGAVKDSFTGLYNKIHFENELKTFFELSRRENIPLSLIILDIDDFKKINDTYGHFIGDKVIKEVTSIIKNSIRNYNLPYRVGGEEFAIILPNCRKNRAYEIAERIRKKIRESKILLDHDESINISVSIGIKELDRGESLEEFFKMTDRALYLAKKSGKNKTVLYEKIM